MRYRVIASSTQDFIFFLPMQDDHENLRRTMFYYQSVCGLSKRCFDANGRFYIEGNLKGIENLQLDSWPTNKVVEWVWERLKIQSFFPSCP